MTVNERFELRTGCKDEDITEDILQSAEDYILNLTNRASLPDNMQSLLVDVAVALYHNGNHAGEKSRSQGDVSVTYETDIIPADIKSRIYAKRKLRACGEARE